MAHLLPISIYTCMKTNGGKYPPKRKYPGCDSLIDGAASIQVNSVKGLTELVNAVKGRVVHWHVVFIWMSHVCLVIV